jgi:hypothetical protein
MKPSVSAMSPSVILSEAKDLMPIANGAPVASGDEVLRYAQDDRAP